MLFYLKYCHRKEKRWHLWWESNPGPPVQPTEPTATAKFQDWAQVRPIKTMYRRIYYVDIFPLFNTSFITSNYETDMRQSHGKYEENYETFGENLCVSYKPY